MRIGLLIIISFTSAALMSACVTLYEHKPKTPEYLNKVKTTIAIGDSRQKVHEVLGKPLIEPPSHELEVFLESSRYYGVMLALPPLMPFPIVGDNSIAGVVVLYDEKGVVKNISTGLWRQVGHGYVSASVDIDGFSFTNITRRKPATLLSPIISSKDIGNIIVNQEKCALFFDMGRCPMEKISLDGNELVEFDRVGAYCHVDGAIYPGSIFGSDHILLDTLFWKQTEPGMHNIIVHLRGPAFAYYKKSFTCKPGGIVKVKLLASRFIPDAWYKFRLEGSIQITYGLSNIISKPEGARFILWHEGTWYGLPNIQYKESE